jgi:hypothetical protein
LEELEFKEFTEKLKKAFDEYKREQQNKKKSKKKNQKEGDESDSENKSEILKSDNIEKEKQENNQMKN